MGLLDRMKGGRCIGMDLSANAVKIAILTRKGNRIILRGGLVAPVSKISLNMDSEKRKALGRQITAIWRSTGIKENKIALSIPGKATLIGRLKLPASAGESLDRMVFSELSEQMPLQNYEELSIDHFVYSKDKNETDILYVAVKQDVVKFFEDIFEKTEFEISSIYSTQLALANVINVNHSDEMVDLPFLVVDVGAYESNFVAMKENRIVASTSLDTGGVMVTHSLASHKGFSFKDAEKMKLTGKGDESVLRESAHTLALQLQEGIERCLNDVAVFCGERQQIEAIYITGGGSHTPFLMAELSSALGMNIKHLLPIRKIDLHPDLNPTHIYDISPQLSVAVGTALSRI